MTQAFDSSTCSSLNMLGIGTETSNIRHSLRDITEALKFFDKNIYDILLSFVITITCTTYMIHFTLVE